MIYRIAMSDGGNDVVTWDSRLVVLAYGVGIGLGLGY